MHHFFLPPDHIQADTVRFPGDIGRQIAAVLRLTPGTPVLVLDGLGQEYEVELVEVGRQEVLGRVVARRPAQGEPGARLTLYLALTQREKFEWMLQKCTEVGAAAFVPLITSRSLVQEGSDAGKKLERWQRIVREAAEQSGRGMVPTVHPPRKFEAALEEAQAVHSVRLIAWEQEQSVSLRQTLTPNKGAPDGLTIAVCIGPEGGFSEAEIEAARRAGFQPITLGKRTLRMETAAIVAAALILYEVEE